MSYCDLCKPLYALVNWVISFNLFSCSCNLQQAPQRAIRYRTGQRYMDISIKINSKNIIYSTSIKFI